MTVRFPSLEFFRGLQQRTRDAAPTFEKLGYCDTRFGVKIGDRLYTVEFEVYECMGTEEGGDETGLDFVLEGSAETWTEMVRSIVENEGADAAHTLNTLSHIGDVLEVRFEDPEGFDMFYRFMATLQEFFDQAHHLDVALEPGGRP